MFQDKFIFAQLTSFLDRNHFNYLVRKYDGVTYCLVAIVQHNMQLKRSNYEVLQILSISLTDKTTLRNLFEKTSAA